MAASNTPTTPRTYGNWRTPSSPGILGLGSLGTAALLGGLIMTVIAVMVSGLVAALVVGSLVGLSMFVVVTRDAHGKSLASRWIERIGWIITRRQGSHLYRSGPTGFAVWGTYQLPGIAAPIRLSEHHDAYNRPFALLTTPATSSYAVVIGTEPDGSALVDQDQVDQWVADWGHWLANLGDEPGIQGAAVTIETAPDTGHRLRREVLLNTDPNAPAFARQMLDEVVAAYPVGSSTVRAFISLTFSASTRPGSRRRQADEMAREIAARLPGLTAGLQSTGAGAATPVAAQELCEAILVAYDPASAVLLDRLRADGETPDLRWSDVGPSGTQASWDTYRHDSAVSATWAMSSAPRGNVPSSILTRLLAPRADIARKRVTLLYRPIDSGRAAAIVESDLRAAEFRATSTAKPAARDTLAVRAAAATAAEEASGAGLLQFGMVVTATVTDDSMLSDVRATIDNLGASARLRLRPVYGSQDSAFAAGLPLGLVIPNHLSVPSEVRERI